MKRYNVLLKFALLSVAIPLLTGCYEDKGNYDYRPARTATIGNIDDTYQRILGTDTLTIYPSVSISNAGSSDPVEADEQNYKFEWMFLGKTIDGEFQNQTVFHEGKNLDKMPLGLSKGEHDLCLKVTNSDGVSFFSKIFKVRVQSQLGVGLLFMCDVNNRTRLDYLNYFNNKLTLLTDITALMGSDAPLSGAPISISCYQDNNSPVWASPVGERYGIAVMTEGEAFWLGPNDFSYLPQYNIRARFSRLSAIHYDFRPTHFITMAADTPSNQGYIYDSSTKNLYTYSGMMATSDWSPTAIANRNMMGVRFNSSPVLYHGMPFSYVFDSDSKSFHSHMAMNNAVMPGPGTLQNMGKDPVFIHQQGVDPLVIIMRNEAGEYSLVRQNTMGVGFSDNPITLEEPDRILGYYMMDHLTNPFVYYYTEDNVYVLNLNTHASRRVYPTAGDPMPSGHKISLMKMVRNGTTSASLWKNKIMICTYSPSLPQESCGRFMMWEQTGSQGELQPFKISSVPMVWEGLGRVVDADFKQQ